MSAACDIKIELYDDSGARVSLWQIFLAGKVRRLLLIDRLLQVSPNAVELSTEAEWSMWLQKRTATCGKTHLCSLR